MSFGEQDEVYWLDLDEAVRIERTAANLATLVAEDSGMWLGEDARAGWGDHLLGESPDPARGAGYMAGWLARQIWCHGRGDDSEHVDHSHAPAPDEAPTYYPDYIPHNAEQFAQMMKHFTRTVSADHLQQVVTLYGMDQAFYREDIMVAMGRVEREKGWTP